MAIIVGGAILVGVAYRWHQYHQLSNYIDSEFETQITSLIAACQEWEHPTFPDPTDFEKSEAMKQTLGQLFDDPVFFDVDWSNDSHHGLRSIKHLPEGYRYDQFSKYTVDDDTMIKFATSDSGVRLVIYERWVEDGRTMRHFSMTFRRSLLEKRMAAVAAK